MKRVITLDFLVLTTATVLSVIAAAYVYSQGLTNVYVDSVARLNIARRVLSSSVPGFANLGYIWLPLQTLLMLPFIWVDVLYFSGFAGVLSSMLGFIAGSFFIFQIGKLLGNEKVGVLAALIYMLNPNVLYLQATPMSESLYLGSVLGAVYFILLWAKNRQDVHLIYSSVFVLFAAMQRYEGWFFALVITCVLALYVLIVTRNFRKAEGVTLLYAGFAFIGPLLWLVWNRVLFGGWFNFAVGRYSSRYQQADLLSHGLLPSYENIGNTLLHIFYATERVLGIPLLVVGSVGVMYLLWRCVYQKQWRYLLFFVLGAHIPYFFINLYVGNAVIFVPELYPHKLFNFRYTVTFLPFFALSAALLTVKLKHGVQILLLLVVIQNMVWMLSGNVIVVNEGKEGFAGLSAQESRIKAGRWIGSSYDDGLILVDSFNNDSVLFYSQLPSTAWVEANHVTLYGRALEQPEETVDWIVMREGDGIWNRFDGGKYLASYFACSFEYEDIRVFRRLQQVKKDAMSTNVIECGSLALSQ